MPRNGTQHPRYATIKGTAEYADTSPDTIRRWIAAGHLTPFRSGSRFLRVDLNEVRERLLIEMPSVKGRDC